MFLIDLLKMYQIFRECNENCIPLYLMYWNFRLPVSDSGTLTTLTGAKPGTIVVKAISPSASPGPLPAASQPSMTRVIQIGPPGGVSRFVRPAVAAPQVITLNRGQVRPSPQPSPTSVSGVTPGAPIIVRTSTSPNSVPVWPSQPLTTIQVQDLFQRPRPPGPLPTVPTSMGLQRLPTGSNPIVRTILVPRSSTSVVAGTSTTVTIPGGGVHVNTPLPNIQLPSEPVPISPQVIMV